MVWAAINSWAYFFDLGSIIKPLTLAYGALISNKIFNSATAREVIKSND